VSLIARYGLLAAILALLIAAMLSGAWRWISLAELRSHHAVLKALVAARPVIAGGAMLAAFVAVVAACLPGITLMASAAGYLFGAAVGGLISLDACVIGSVLVFLACRSAFAEAIARRSGPRAAALEKAFGANAFSYLLSLKLIPAMPYFVPNVAAGLAGVRLMTVIAATALGSAPVCFILAGLGAGLGKVIDRGGPLSEGMFMRPAVLAPLIGLSLLAVASLAFRVLRQRRP
jgi:uncharacterized membrane protein YdjX (TVP38/TMEM64 family)